MREALEDSAVMDTLAELLPKARSDPKVAVSTASLIAVMRAVDHPAVVELFLDGLRAEADPSVRSMTVFNLTPSLGEDPRVRKALQEIAAHDPDPATRAACRRFPAARDDVGEAGVAATLMSTAQPEAVEPDST